MHSIKANEVLVGDIVHVEAGDIVISDGLIVSMEHEIKADESDATGESDAIGKVPFQQSKNSASDTARGGQNGYNSQDTKKKDSSQAKADPFLLSGSKILEGKGHYLVLAVGTSSFQGKIFMSLRSTQPDQTRMQKQLSHLAEQIAKIASFAGGALFLALFIRNCVDLRTMPYRTPAEKGQGFIQSFVISVTLVVVAVPEGMFHFSLFQ